MSVPLPSRRRVGIVATAPRYPAPPFSPRERYPEYPWDTVGAEENGVYAGLRQLLLELGLDREHFGHAAWNPLGAVIQPGDKVLLKPNFVHSRHFAGGQMDCVVTHGAVVRAVLDYVLVALRGRGRVVIGDSPERAADFQQIVQGTGVDAVMEFCQERRAQLGDVELLLSDLRPEWVRCGHGAITQKKPLPGDPEGYCLVTLAHEESAFLDLTPAQLRRLYGADHNRRETVRAHAGAHRYELCGTALGADVIVCVPKLKTHYRVGTTLNCKGFVGLTGNKNLVPHRMLGDPSEGGDTYVRPARTWRGRRYRAAVSWLSDQLLGRMPNTAGALANRALSKVLRLVLRPAQEEIEWPGGCWHGNDTTWRSTVDLARLFRFADRHGRLAATPQRRFFSIVDGIVGGEGDGPMRPRRRPCGVLLGGADLLAVDVVATQLMGFAPSRVKYLQTLLRPHGFDLSLACPEQIEIASNVERYRRLWELPRAETLCFEPPSSWIGCLEL